MLTTHTCMTVSFFSRFCYKHPWCQLCSVCFHQQPLTIITCWAARHGLPLPESWRQTCWWASSLRSPGTARRAGLDLWHRAADNVAAASTSIPLSVCISHPTISSWGVFSEVDPWGGAVAAAGHTYRGWRDDARRLFLISCILVAEVTNRNTPEAHSDLDAAVDSAFTHLLALSISISCHLILLQLMGYCMFYHATFRWQLIHQCPYITYNDSI